MARDAKPAGKAPGRSRSGRRGSGRSPEETEPGPPARSGAEVPPAVAGLLAGGTRGPGAAALCLDAPVSRHPDPPRRGTRPACARSTAGTHGRRR